MTDEQGQGYRADDHGQKPDMDPRVLWSVFAVVNVVLLKVVVCGSSAIPGGSGE